MKKRLQGLIAGLLIGLAVAGGATYAAQTVKIVIDGQEIIPKDVNGNRVDPIIIDGTTYLPVRAVADAFGKSVYWDGPNYTVYLGDMGGNLEYPTVYLNSVDNIGNSFYNLTGSNSLTDNYGNSYSYAISSNTSSSKTFQTLLNMKYSRFKCTIYVPKGCNKNTTAKVLIKTDGKIVYTSPDITKTSGPINVDVDVTGCNDFQIQVTNGQYLGYIGDGGFYQ